MSENLRQDGDAARAPGRTAYPEDLARTFTKRPAMYIGEAKFEQAIGFTHGLEHALLPGVRTSEDLCACRRIGDRNSWRSGAATTTERRSRLEPVIVAVDAQLQFGDEITWALLRHLDDSKSRTSEL